VNKLIVSAIFFTILPLNHAMAGEMGEVKDEKFNVYVPNLPTTNEYTVSALFLRPSGNTDYAVLVNPFNPSVADPGLSPHWVEKNVTPDFNAGFSLNFRHIFPNSGNDTNLYWARLRTSDTGTFPVDRRVPPYTQFTGPNWDIGPDGATTHAANGKVKFSYDVLNVEVGKSVNFDPNLRTRFFTGVSGVWLMQQNYANFTGTDPVYGPYTFDITTQSKYNAAGIRLGIDGEYQGMYHINPVGLLAGTLFVGSQQPANNTKSTGGGTTAHGIPVNYQSIQHSSYIQVVPALDAKLGLKYSRSFSNDRLFTLEGGYMAAVYVNAIQNYVQSSTVPGSLGIVTGAHYLQSLIKTTDSFALDGPYVSLAMKM